MEARLSLPTIKGLEFSEEGHVYLLDGEQIPSVTQLMEPLNRREYMRVDSRTLEMAAQRGTAVHNAIENYLKYGLDDIDPDYRCYMDGFHEWWEEYNPEFVASEMRVYHKLYRYAGTADLLAIIDGKLTLVDFKTTYKLSEKSVRVQLEAYSQAMGSHGIIIDGKMVLHLSADGKWKSPEFPDKDTEALRVFNSLRCVHDYLAK